MYKKVVVFFIITSFLLTGCWDKIEIEERAHISAVGIDKYNSVSNEQKLEKANDESYSEEAEGARRSRYKFTFSFPEHKKDNAKDIVVSTVGPSLYSVSRIAADRTNREMFLGHLRTVIIGSDIAKDPKLFREILDGIENNELLSRRVVLAMSEDFAEDIIKIEPSMEPMIGQFIAELFRRKDKTPRTPKGSIGDILKDLHESGNTVIPKITPGVTDVKIAGAGVINNYQLKGWLGELETVDLLTLKGEAGILGGLSVNYKNHNIPIEMRPKKPKLTLIEDKDNIKIFIEIKMEGDVKQTYFEAKEDLLKTETVEEIEDLIKKTIEQRLKSTIAKVQKELETDIIGIDRYLRQSHYKLWTKIENDWQDIFPNIDIKVSIDAKIRRIGLVR